MNRTSVALPEDLARLLESEATRVEVSVSELIRRAIAKYLGYGTSRRRKLPFAGLGRSGRHDTARRADAILRKEWGRAVAEDSKSALELRDSGGRRRARRR